MQPIERLREKLSKYPDLEVRDESNALTALAPDSNGFDVAFVVEDESYTVWLGPWPQGFELTEEQSALEFFAFGLSGEARLRVKSRGGKDYSSTLEALEQGEWRSYSTTALLFFPFWRPRQVRYLQNQAPGAGPNNSSKPTPLRGAA